MKIFWKDYVYPDEYFEEVSQEDLFSALDRTGPLYVKSTHDQEILTGLSYVHGKPVEFIPKGNDGLTLVTTEVKIEL